MAAARALGRDPGLTLMVEVDGRPACCVVPSDRLLSMKKVAAMMAPARVGKLTGHCVGCISPFGQKRFVPVVEEERAGVAETVWINAGRCGLLRASCRGAAVQVLGAKLAGLVV